MPPRCSACGRPHVPSPLGNGRYVKDCTCRKLSKSEALKWLRVDKSERAFYERVNR